MANRTNEVIDYIFISAHCIVGSARNRKCPIGGGNIENYPFPVCIAFQGGRGRAAPPQPRLVCKICTSYVPTGEGPDPGTVLTTSYLMHELQRRQAAGYWDRRAHPDRCS